MNKFLIIKNDNCVSKFIDGINRIINHGKSASLLISFVVKVRTAAHK